jgi:hypothetical protein
LACYALVQQKLVAVVLAQAQQQALAQLEQVQVLHGVQHEVQCVERRQLLK